MGERKGVKKGWAVSKVDDIEYSKAVLDAQIAAKRSFSVSFKDADPAKYHSYPGPNAGRIGNHAKFFMIDNKCFYIGSQNMYEADLAEWGLIVDDTAAAACVLTGYWNPLWREARDYACDGDGILAANPDAAQEEDHD